MALTLPSGEARPERAIEVGRISGAYGVRGWVKVNSYTQEPSSILRYAPWFLDVRGIHRPVVLVEGRSHGSGVVVKLDGVDDREQAVSLTGSSILICRESLPELRDGQYYWDELIGMRVQTLAGFDLGWVTDLMETGANDVLVVAGERERLVPFVLGVHVAKVDRGAGLIIVDWDPDD